MKTPCAEPGCPVLVDCPDGPEITAESYCPKHRVLYEPESAERDELEEQIAAKLEALRSLQLDHVIYQSSAVLLDRYNRVALPSVRRFIRLLHETGQTHRLIDLADLGYQVTLDHDGELTGLRIRGWGVEPTDYGP